MDQQHGSSSLKSFTMLLVAALWVLPTWAVWHIAVKPEWQQGLTSWQVGVLMWYPILAILMLYFVVVLYRRLPNSWIGIIVYIIGTVGMAASHWWLSGAHSLTLLMIEWAAFSLTLFVVGFSLELFRRIGQMAMNGSWVIAVFGGLLNIMIFVMPGIMTAISLYAVLYHREVFAGGLLVQIPYVVGLAVAIWHDWRTFRTI
ncbi:MAG: hypothetical protein AAF431_18325 [Pseudomonadota bacterium]